MKKIVKKEDTGNRPNPYCCPDFEMRLLKLCRHFVLWTTVMSGISANTSDSYVNKNLVATSARSEEYFREIKNFTFKGAKSHRVDKFVILYLRSLEGTIKLLHAPNNFPSQREIKPHILTTEKKLRKKSLSQDDNNFDNADIYRVIQNNNLSLKCHIPDIILRRFFSFTNILSEAVFFIIKL